LPAKPGNTGKTGLLVIIHAMKLNFRYIQLIFLALLYQGIAFGMVSPPADSSLLLDDTYNEKFELVTDRNIYAVGEKIYFRAFNLSPEIIRQACWSKVMYVQLINQNGGTVEKGKFELSCSGSRGFIEIPEDILTGNYYLSANTKWMRNFSPLAYGYRAVKIINPYTPEIAGPGKTDNSEHIPPKRKLIPEEHVKSIIVRTDKPKYMQGEEVSFSIEIPDNVEPSRLTAVTCRPGATDTLIEEYLISDSPESRNASGINFLPEIRGLSISGKIVLKDSDKPVKDAQVELSVLGMPHSFFVYTTKEDGRFYFALDSISGDHELFIASRHEQYPDLDINIDKDFSDFHSGMFHQPFQLSPSEKKLAEEIMINMQAAKIYDIPEPSVQSNPDSESARIAFYNIPLDQIKIDEFIELPNLKEVFIELVPEVIPVTRRKRTSLYLTGNTLTTSFIKTLKPLILLDQLPVYDIKKLLAISPKRIQSIEVLNEVYVLGHKLYGGIINITSIKGDMAGMDLPVNSIFFPYSGFLPTNGSTLAANHIAQKDLPDFRNSLTWEPDITLLPGETKSLQFYTSDRSGKYMILIRGYTEEGTPLQGITYFDVE
jgi:hypothetical protein